MLALAAAPRHLWRHNRLPLVGGAAGLALALCLALLPLKLGAAITGGLGGLLAVLMWPEVGLYLLAFAVPYGTEVSVSVGSFSVGALDALVGLVVLVWLLTGVYRHAIRLPNTLLFYAFVLFVLALLPSVSGAFSLSLAFKEYVKWLEALAVYVVAVDLLRGRRQLVLLVLALFAAAGTQALLGYYQFITASGPPGFLLAGRFMRAYGSFAQPNPMGGYLNWTLSLAVALFLFLPRGWLRQAALLAAAGVGGALVATLSRGALLGGAAALSLVAVVRDRRWVAVLAGALVLGALVGLLGAFALLPQDLIERLKPITLFFSVFDVRTVTLTEENFSVVERMAHWQAGWEMFLSSPWTGVGLGNYPAVYEQFRLEDWKESLGHAHNYYINMAAEAGVAGLTGFLALLATAFASAARGLARLARSEFDENGRLRRGLLAGTLGVLTAASLHSLVDSLFVHGMAVLFGLTLALITVATRDDE